MSETLQQEDDDLMDAEHEEDLKPAARNIKFEDNAENTHFQQPQQLQEDITASLPATKIVLDDVDAGMLSTKGLLSGQCYVENISGTVHISDSFNNWISDRYNDWDNYDFSGRLHDYKIFMNKELKFHQFVLLTHEVHTKFIEDARHGSTLQMVFGCVDFQKEHEEEDERFVYITISQQNDLLEWKNFLRQGAIIFLFRHRATYLKCNEANLFGELFGNLYFVFGKCVLLDDPMCDQTAFPFSKGGRLYAIICIPKDSAPAQVRASSETEPAGCAAGHKCKMMEEVQDDNVHLTFVTCQTCNRRMHPCCGAFNIILNFVCSLCLKESALPKSPNIKQKQDTRQFPLVQIPVTETEAIIRKLFGRVVGDVFELSTVDEEVKSRLPALQDNHLAQESYVVHFKNLREWLRHCKERVLAFEFGTGRKFKRTVFVEIYVTQEKSFTLVIVNTCNPGDCADSDKYTDDWDDTIQKTKDLYILRVLKNPNDIRQNRKLCMQIMDQILATCYPGNDQCVKDYVHEEIFDEKASEMEFSTKFFVSCEKVAGV